MCRPRGRPRRITFQGLDIVASTDLQDLPEERRAVVARLRREIALGTYETPARLEAALDAFLDQSEGNGSGPANKGDFDDPWRSDLFR